MTHKKIMWTITATIIAVASMVIFNGCQKENEFETTKTQGVKQEKNLFGYWTDWFEVANAPSFNGHTGEGFGWYTCTRTFTRSFMCECCKKHVIYSETVTQTYPCYGLMTTTNSPSLKIDVRVASHILNVPKAEYADVIANLDFSDITNFEFYVEDVKIVLTPDFYYEKPFTFEMTDDNDEVIVVTSMFRVTYEDIINLWQELWHR